MSREIESVMKEDGMTAYSCSPCSRDDVNETATHFCFECQEHMCDMCTRYHKRSKATLRHQLTRVDEMKPDQLQLASFSSDEVDIQVTCKLHNFKKFKYICRTDKALCCSRCVIEHHRSCKDVLHLSEYIVHEDYKKQLKTNERNFASLTENTHRLLAYETQHVDLILKMEKRETEKGDVVRDKLLARIQQAFSDRNKLIKANANSIVANSEKLQADSRKSLSEIQRYQNSQDHSKQYGNDANKVITVRSVANFMDRARKELVAKFTNMSRKTLVTDFQVGELEKRISAISEIKTERLTRVPPRYVAIPVLSSSIKLSVKDISKPPCLRECSILDGGIVVATDESGNVIRLFDTNQATEITSFKVESEPWGIAQIEGNKIAISLPFKKKILVLKCQNKILKNESTIKTESECWGMTAYKKDKKTFIAAYSKTKLALNCISIENMKMEEVDIKVQSRVSLSHINSIAADGDIGQFYLSCSKEHKVFACDFEGHLIWQVSHSLHTPMGLCVDSNGVINICSFGTHEIRSVNSSGEILKVFVSNEDLNGPVAMAFMKGSDKFVVCDHDPGNVRIKIFCTEGK